MPKSSLSILMTADTIGGVWNYCLSLIEGLPDYHFHLATMGRPLSASQRLEANALENLQVYESSYRLEWMASSSKDIEESGEWLLRLEEATQADVIHLNGYAHGLLPWRAPSLVVAHSDVCSWYRYVRHETAPSEWDFYRQKVARGLQGARALVVPTAAVLDDLRYSFHALPDDCMVIPNFLSTEKMTQLPIAEKENYILSAGRMWDEAKNISMLSQISKDLSWPIFVAGETAHPENGEQPPISHLHLLGNLSSRGMSACYRRASIFAAPVRYEPFGLGILEAATQGCALLLGDIPSLRENWEDAAIFVNPFDREEIKSALLNYIKYPTLRKTYADAAFHRAQSFSPKTSLSRYADLYETLTTGAAVRRSLQCAS